MPTGVFAATADFGSDEAGRSLADRVHRAAAELVALMGLPAPAGRVVTEAEIGPGPAQPGRPAGEPDPFESFVPFDELLARR